MNAERRFLLDTEQHRDNAARFIGKLPVEEVMELIVRPYTPQRTSSQNRRLWALHGKAAEFTGHTADEMHEEALCRHFGYTEVTMPTGWVKRVPIERSSTKDKKKFADFMTATETWYIEDFGVWLE